MPRAAASAAPAVDGSAWFPVALGAVIASQAMVVGLAVNLSEPTGALRGWLHGALIVSALAAFAVLGLPLARAAWSCACQRTVRVELLFLAGVVGAFGASVWATWTGTGAVYYEVVAILLTVFTAGKVLTARAKAQALTEARRLRETFDPARVLGPDGRATPERPVTAVEPGDLLQVFPGEAIPVDGRIVRGEALVRETPLSGEPGPAVRRPGDSVLAGSFSEDGELVIEATRAGRSRRLDDLLRRVEAAQQSLAGTLAQAQADRLAAVFLPVVLAVAAGTFIAWGAQGRWSDALFNSLSVLLVACPCALGLATPLTLWHTLTHLAARGFVARDAATLERLANVTSLVCDKTGTLSTEQVALIDFVTTGDAVERSRWLEILAEIQRRSSHPFARAFVGAGSAGGTGVEIRSFRSVPANGVEAWVVDGAREHHVRVGRAEWLVVGTQKIAADELIGRLHTRGSDALVFVASDGVVMAVAQLREQARNAAAVALARARGLGLRVRLLSGDSSERAHDLAGELGAFDEILIGQSPTDKSDRIEAWQAQGERVLFVGDGVNDAPALAVAEVGVAMDAGAPLATATADVVLCGGALHEVPEAVRMARQAQKTIRGSLSWAASYNAIGMALAALGHLHPVAAALLMVGSSAVVTWRSVRAIQCEPDAIANRKSSNPSNGLIALSLGLQIPLLAWLGALSATQTWFVGALLSGLAILAVTRFWRPFRARFSGGDALMTMTLSMLGPGGLLMLVGWWAEAEFGRVMRDGMCLCCGGHSFFEPWETFPWMYLGMLGGGLPLMWPALARWRGRFGRWPAAALTAVGMCLGMAWGARVALKAAGPMHPAQFLIAFTGMSLGMLFGMFFACALGEVLWGRAGGANTRAGS
jgi:heavy metal translocating P-type ATPase